MKKTLAASPLICCILLLFIPFCNILARVFGYSFELYNAHLTAAVIAMSVGACAVGVCVCGITGETCRFRVLTLFLPMLSLFYTMFFLEELDWVTGSFLALTFVGCCSLFFDFAPYRAAKIALGILTLFWFFITLFIIVLNILISDFESVRVVKSALSPTETHVAEIVVHDYLSTDVQVRRAGSIPILVGEFTDVPETVYSGGWYDQTYIQIAWRDAQTLLIDNKPYVIE